MSNYIISHTSSTLSKTHRTPDVADSRHASNYIIGVTGWTGATTRSLSDLEGGGYEGVRDAERICGSFAARDASP